MTMKLFSTFVDDRRQHVVESIMTTLYSMVSAAADKCRMSTITATFSAVPTSAEGASQNYKGSGKIRILHHSSRCLQSSISCAMVKGTILTT